MSIVGDVLDRLTALDDPRSIDATPDDVLGLIANERRRLVIHALAEAGSDPVELGSLTEAIAAAENDCPPGDLTHQQYKRVYVGLYQTHMPQIVDAGAAEEIERGHGSNVYRATDMAHVLDELATGVERRCAEEPERTDADAVAERVAEQLEPVESGEVVVR